jgi:hypothetical protein
MKRERLLVLSLALAALMLLSATAFAQLPPAVDLLPPGFKVTVERNLGGSQIVNGTKPNENFPKPHADQGIVLEISWMDNPAVDQVLEMAAAQTEDPAGRIPGSATREEPCGRERYRDGVRQCRKVITPWIGGGSGPELVTWRIRWTGKGPKGGLVGVSVNNFYGSKEAAQGLIDAVILNIAKGK